MEKRRKNYWMSFLLALSLLFGGTASSALAQSADVEIVAPTFFVAGEVVTVDIVVRDHPNFRGADFNITYDPYIFTYIDGQTTDGSSWPIANFTDDGPGSVNVLLAGAAGQVPAAVETTLLQLFFDTADMIPDDSYNFAITYDETDPSKGIIDDTMTPLILTITGESVSLPIRVTATVSTGAETGIIEPAGESFFNAGDTPTYTITPSDCYGVLAFTVDGEDRLAELSNGTSGGTFTFYPPLLNGDNIAITVAFEQLPGCRLPGGCPVILPSENGTISGPMICNEGETPTYTVTPDPHYEIDTFEVLGDENAVLTDNGDGTYSYTFAALPAGSAIAATFKIKQYAVTATADENGAISPAGETEYAALSTPEYTITPNPLYNCVIDTVTVDGADVTGTENYVLNEDRTAVYTFPALEGPAVIEATFTGILNITVTRGIGGSVKAVDNEIIDDVVTVFAGDDQKFKVTAKEGYYIKRVKVDGEKIPLDEDEVTSFSYTFRAIDADHTFKVKFGEMHTITAFAGENGTISPAGDIMVADGDSVTFTITPDENYVVEAVTVDGTEVELTDGTYTFESVDANHAIAASFRRWRGIADIILNGGDYDYDFRIIFDELLRIIQLYNSGAYHCDESGMDGFAPGEGDPLTDYACKPHGSDYDDAEMGNAQDWVIDFGELLRAIQFYNSDGYHVDETTSDGFAPDMTE
ncbi:InlB B-repeat-containing protein [Desulfonema magnum]|uniref:Cohesin domain-containing protein n=1 Tax=Desulfonema magnum TaxID=45655 RepID=A0A975GTN6_9BACT|nr:cohesin domain-containing protein [Desulfonema magnum]QTA93300.1 Cohesin domain-containing protein [Desulfonema magnum]